MFRLSTTLVTTLVLTQAMLAGDFLSGRFESLALHARNGGIVASALLAQTVTAILLWRRAGAPSWPVRTSVIQLVIAAGLIPLGEARMLALHIPVAVGLAVGTALLTTWAWRWER
ncbi:hypothetical protein GCM10027088_03930 [Nocardia goodfellowii]